MMNKLKLLLAASVVFLTVGCEQGLTERERECMELTQDAEHCIRGANRHVQYVPQYQPRENINYYGHPDHGYWQNGVYNFHDPLGEFATSTNAFLLGAGLGGYAAYKLTKKANRSAWRSSNPNGWAKKTQYVDKKGKIISASEYQRRKQQSARDKAKHQAKVNANKANLNKRPVPTKKPVANKGKVDLSKKANSLVTKKPSPNLNKKPVNKLPPKRPLTKKPVYNKKKTQRPSYSKPTRSYSKPTRSSGKKRGR